MKFNQGGLRFLTGILLGYCFVQGVKFLNTNYLWTLFYHH